jgi:hypothetical protein
VKGTIKMATKKEKRAAALARREEFLAAEAARNQKVLEGVRAKRRAEEKKAWQKNHDKRHSWKKRIKECPICQDELRAIPKDQQRLEAATAEDLPDEYELAVADAEERKAAMIAQYEDEMVDGSSMEMECI